MIDVTLSMTVTSFAQSTSPSSSPSQKNPAIHSEKQHILSDRFVNNNNNNDGSNHVNASTTTATTTSSSIYTEDATTTVGPTGPSTSPSSSSSSTAQRGLTMRASFRQQKPYVDSHPDIERHIGQPMIKNTSHPSPPIPFTYTHRKLF